MSASMRAVRRRAVSLNEESLVTAGDLTELGSGGPLVFRPSVAGVDLGAWARSAQRQIVDGLQQRGFVLLRGFGVDSAQSFAAAAAGLAGDLYGDYGDLPRESEMDSVFSSTPYPADLSIHFHNESSHMARWPMKIMFCCAVAAETGGETPVIDCRMLYRDLDQGLVRDFEDKGLAYVRNFAEGLDVAWEDFFQTSDRDEVERRCAADGGSVEWLSSKSLRIRQVLPAVRTHAETGTKVFFNQVLLHHPAALPPATRTAMLELYDREFLPRNVTFGDGSAIPDDAIDYLVDFYAKHGVGFRWEQGDILLLDNMTVAHSRSPFTGSRKIMVAMAGIVEGDQ